MFVHIQSLEARRLFAMVLDDSFGENGFVPEGDKIIQLAGRRSDGGVLYSLEYTAARYDPDGGLLVRPYRTDGSIDRSFQTSNEYDNGSGNSFAVDSQDRLIWFGDAYHYSPDYTKDGYKPTVDRYNPDGTHDDTFAQVTLPDPPKYKGIVGDPTTGNRPQVDAQNRILLQTYVTYEDENYEPLYTRVYIDRLNADGTRDTTFGDNGRLLISTTRGYGGAGYAVTPDGGIMVLRSPNNVAATLTRYTSGGRLDTAYGDAGTMTLTDNLMPSSIQLTVDKQGRAVIAYLRDDKPKRVQVRRYTAAGRLDTTFGSGGLTSLHDLAFRDGSVDFFTIDDQNRVVGSVDYGLFRLTADGASDLTFAPNGVINTGNIDQTNAIVTPEGIYTPATIGRTTGVARFVETGTVTLNAASGELSVIGTTKADTIRVRPKGSGQGVGVGVTLNGGSETVYRNVKSLRISALRGDDSVTTSVSVPTFVGLAGGNDTLAGGGRGAFTVLGGDGNDKIVTGDAADSINGGFGDDTMYAGAGDDRVQDLDGNNSVHGGAGRDSLRTGDGRDVLYGDDGNDTLRAAGGTDHLYGNDDDDLMFAGTGTAFVYGGGGYDRAVIDSGNYEYDGTLEVLL